MHIKRASAHKHSLLIASILLLLPSSSFAESNDGSWTKIGGVQVRARPICATFHRGEKAKRIAEISWIVRNTTNKRTTVRVESLSQGGRIEGRWSLKQQIPITGTTFVLDWREDEYGVSGILNDSARREVKTGELGPRQQVLLTTRFAPVKAAAVRDFFRLDLRVGKASGFVVAATSLCMSVLRRGPPLGLDHPPVSVSP